MKHIVLKVALAAAICVGFSGAGGAAPIVDVNITGVVTEVDDPLGGEFTVGDQLSASFSYDLATPDSNSFFISLGSYIDAITSLSFTIGSYTGGLVAPGSISVGTIFDHSFLANASQISSPSVAGLAPENFGLRLLDSTESAFASAALPAALSLADFDTRTWSLEFRLSENQLVSVSGTLDLNAVAAVPLPAALPLLLAGLVGLGVVGTRRSRAT